MSELDDDTRARLALIASFEALTATGLEIEDLTDPDARSVAIRANHPELDEALADGRDHVTVAGEPMNIRLHLAMHEVVAKQLADDGPPEVYETARRLLDAGYDRHEVLHMPARPIASQIHATPTDRAALRPRPARRRAPRAPRLPGAGARATEARQRPPTPVPRKQTAPMKPSAHRLTSCRAQSDGSTPRGLIDPPTDLSEPQRPLQLYERGVWDPPSSTGASRTGCSRSAWSR